MFELIRLGLRVGWRGVGLRVLLPLALLVLVASVLGSGFSGRQPSSVALDVGLTGLRLVLLVVALLWVQDLFARDIERKTVYFMLAYPLTRTHYLLSRFFTVALLALVALVLIGGLLWLSMQVSRSYVQVTPVAIGHKYLLVLLGIWLDALVVTAFALCIASLSTTPFLPLILGLCFGMAARGLGPTLDYLMRGERSSALHSSLFGPVLEYAFLWLPDLSRLDWRPIVLYDLPVGWDMFGLAVLSALGYIGLLLALASAIFGRRNFT